MYKEKTVSLVLPAFNEEKGLVKILEEFRRMKIIDEIIVVDNNSTDLTAKTARENGARVIREKNQGFGFAIMRGMKAAKGELIILCEPDGTFSAKDALRLLSKTHFADAVLGSRTNKNYITKNANMGVFIRTGNIFVAKLLQVLYRTNKLTDCGCTYRVFHRSLVDKIMPYLTVGKSHFLPETVILSTFAEKTILEIPVSYGNRIGDSKITGSLKRAISVGIQMLYIIFKYKFDMKLKKAILNQTSPR